MKSYIVVKKKHSEKKNKDYLASYIVFNDTEYMINLSNEILAIMLNKTAREIIELPLGFESDHFKLEVAE